MNYRSIFVIAVILSVSLASAVMAETIYLKNGTTVEGKIITDEPSRIQVDIGGIPKTISRGEIERISKGIEEESVMDLKDKPVKALKDIPESKRALIKRFLEANGARESMGRTFSQIMATAPAESQKMLKDTLRVDDLITQMIPLYDKYYSEQELKELIVFYSSPIGKKLIQITPFLMKDVMDTSGAYFKAKAGSGFAR